MDLLWPWFLLLLGLIPLIVAAYIWALRRRRRFALRYSSLALLRPALPQQSRLRRHLPFALLLIALAGMIVALGRPVAIVTVPTNQTTIIIAIDVSGSMRSVDIKPSRIEAAQAAALDFIQRQRGGTQIGIVAFSGNAELVQAPTTDQEALQAAIDRLTPQRSTAIGSGILKSLDAIAEVDPNVASSVIDPAAAATPTPVPKGAYAPDVVVLLTDGVSNAGPLPLDAAQQAADRGVRVYTIAFGTDNGSIPDQSGGRQFGGQGQSGGGQFGGGRQFGGRFRMGVDLTTLKQIADMTGGSMYTATSAQQLESVFQSLPMYLIVKHETIEVTAAFTAFGALVLLAAVALGLRWHPLP
jgi:Ca-activated chloride channel family protein